MIDQEGPARARAWATWALVAVSVLSGTAAVELILRVLPLPVLDRIRSGSGAQAGVREPHPRGLYRLHPQVGWTLDPGFAGRFRGADFDIEVQANPDGLRDRSFGPKPKDGMRILGLGDSFAFGWGVENHESLFKRLERRLSQSGSPSEAVNAGIPGFGTYEELQLLRVIGLRYEPDLVILAFYEGNDFRNNGESPRRRLLQDGYLRDATSGSGPWRLLLRHSVVAGLTRAFFAGLTRKLEFVSDVERTGELLAAMKALLDRQHIPLVLLFVPDQDPEVYRRPTALRTYDRLATGMSRAEATDRLREVCTVRDIAFCRLSGRFEGTSNDLRLADTHFNRKGHAAAALELHACLMEHGLVVAGAPES